MAVATKKRRQTYGAEELNSIRLRCIYAKVPTKVLHFVFVKSMLDRPSDMSLLDYYQNKGITISKFKERLYSKQLDKIGKDPEGKSFDVTLLCACFRKGSHGLVEENDSKWHEGNGSMESLITSVKNKRNYMAHDDLPCSNEQLLEETNELRELLTKILRFAKDLYNISPEQIDQEISEMDGDINSYRNEELMPKDFEEYKKQLLSPKLSEYMHKKGNQDVQMQYCNRDDNVTSPLSNLVHLKASMKDIPFEMVLQGKGHTEKSVTVSYEDILKGKGHRKTKSIILVEGNTGAGKTTLVKKIKRDWMSKNVKILKYMSSEDLLLHAECRNPTISSFEGLLRQLMPNVARSFKGEDIKYAALDQQILLILDGLDELNEFTTCLFEEVMQMKKDSGITVLITTRPEKVDYFLHRVQAMQIETKHIKLLGVPLDQIETLVTEYYNEIAKQNPDVQGIQGLLNHIQRTLYRHGDIWKIPFNSVSLTTLWALRFIDDNSIRTAPELYREIYKLYRSRLSDRLRNDIATHHLQDSERERIIEYFLYSLAKESILGIKNNHINLPQEAYQRLTHCCQHINVSIEELIGAFLRRVSSGTITLYSYSHKGLQDFFAAHYIWMTITQWYQSYDVEKIIKAVDAVLSQNDVPVPLSQGIIRFTEGELRMMVSQNTTGESLKLKEEDGEEDVDNVFSYQTVAQKRQSWTQGFTSRISNILWKGERTSSLDTNVANHEERAPSGSHCKTVQPRSQRTSTVRDILTNINGSTTFEMSKYQNTLISLLGLVYAEDDRVGHNVKMEVLSLLQEAGVSDRHAWIALLNSVKSDPAAASFIAQQQGILEGDIKITDSSLSAYIALLQSLHPTLREILKVNIRINVMEESSDLTELITQINRNRLNVSVMNFHHNFKHQTVNLVKLGGAINLVFQRCEMERYMGPITPEMVLPMTIKRLHASIEVIDSFLPLRRFLQSKPNLDTLVLCINPQLDFTGLSPLRGSTSPPCLYLPDIQTYLDVQNASQIVLRLTPTDVRKFNRLYFPRAAINFNGIANLIIKMKGIVVSGSVVFPSKCKPPTPAEVQSLSNLARRNLKCGDGVEWGESFGIDIDRW